MLVKLKAPEWIHTIGNLSFILHQTGDEDCSLILSIPVLPSLSWLHHQHRLFVIVFFSMTHNIQTNKQKSLFPNNPMFWLPPPTQREQGIGAPLRTLHLPKRCYPPPQPLIQLGTPGSCMSKSLKAFNTIILKMQLFLL